MHFERVRINELLADSVTRRRLMINVIMATQAREGIDTTYEQASAAYDKVRTERIRNE